MSLNCPTELFRLRVVLDNPRYTFFGINSFREPSLLGRANLGEDIQGGFGAGETNRLWTQASLAKVW